MLQRGQTIAILSISDGLSGFSILKVASHRNSVIAVALKFGDISCSNAFQVSGTLLQMQNELSTTELTMGLYAVNIDDEFLGIKY